MYLKSFSLPSAEFEADFKAGIVQTCYPSFYPFGIFLQRGLVRLEFEPVTFLYGGNGSGKTTLLNIISETLGLKRRAPFNKSPFFEPYVTHCREIQRKNGEIPAESCIITSDDVFEYLLDIRRMNEGIDCRKEDLLREYQELKNSHFRMESLADYDKLREYNEAQRNSASCYAKNRVMENAKESSNGQSAYRFFTENIRENALYLLDEPENSLSAERQMELCEFLEESARFFGCQFIISTHSPFLLAMKGAKVYDLDSVPIREREWTELENVRRQFDFFAAHADKFKR